MKRTGLIIIGILALLIIWGISVRNGLATAETGINGKWGQVQAQYNRKAKLYENVVNTIKGAARNEDTTLIKIVQMRSRVPNITSESTPEQVAQADKQLNSIGRAALNINVESYPTLQATGLYRDLQAQIEGTENRVTVALGDWNDAITAYNTKIVRFPSNLIAGMFGYKSKQNYVAPVGSEDTKVDFSK
ncbi:MAG TPA: LemA family protein [Ferruginibacter sp.]|jgi:LemA protein|nr:LemA family protein [Ferruginibacter sp.]